MKQTSSAICLRAVILWYFCLPMGAMANDTDLQAWTTGRWQHPLGDRLVSSALVQARFADTVSEADVVLMEAALGYQVRPNLWLSGAYVHFRVLGARKENRLWQELALPMNVDNFIVGHRLRLEARWIDGNEGVVARARYRIRCTHPVPGTRAYYVLWNELFLNLNDQEARPRSGYEQNWLGASLGFHIGRKARFEMGYQWRHLDRSVADRSDHVLGLSVFWDSRGKATAVPTMEEGHQ